MARISETAFVNSPFCGAPEGKFVILSRSKSCHINRMKTCIEIKKNPRISCGENVSKGSNYFFWGEEGGLTENFNMAKTYNLAIPGGGRTPCPPLWIRPCLDSKYYRNNLCKQVELMSELN